MIVFLAAVASWETWSQSSQAFSPQALNPLCQWILSSFPFNRIFLMVNDFPVLIASTFFQTLIVTGWGCSLFFLFSLNRPPISRFEASTPISWSLIWPLKTTCVSFLELLFILFKKKLLRVCWVHGLTAEGTTTMKSLAARSLVTIKPINYSLFSLLVVFPQQNS